MTKKQKRAKILNETFQKEQYAEDCGTFVRDDQKLRLYSTAESSKVLTWCYLMVFLSFYNNTLNKRKVVEGDAVLNIGNMAFQITTIDFYTGSTQT